MILLLKNKIFLFIFTIFLGFSSAILLSISYGIGIGVVLGILLIFVLIATPSEFTLDAILLTIFIDISPITLGGSYVRIYQALLLFYILKLALTTKWHFSTKIPLSVPLLLWFITYFFAYGHIISLKDFKAIIIGQSFLYILYYVIYSTFITYDKNTQLRLIKKYIVGGIIIAIIGLLEYPLIAKGIISNSQSESIGIPRPSSLLREPDWYGTVCMCISLFLITLYLFKSNLIRHKKIYLIICFAGMILSMARAPWVAFALSFIVLFFCLSMRKKVKIIKISIALFLILIASIAVLHVSKPESVDNVLDRLNPTTSASSDNGALNSRILSLQIMIDYIKIHPFTGNGVGSMASISNNKYIIQQYSENHEAVDINAGRGNANIFVTSLFDSGIIGTIFLVIFILEYFIIMIKSYKQTKDPIVLAFMISFLGLIINFQFNNGIRFGFIWIHIALSLAYSKRVSLNWKNNL